MRTDTLKQITGILALRTASTTDIAKTTQLSYSTVRRALEDLGAQPVEDTWPVEWTIPGAAEAVRALPKKLGAPDVDNTLSIPLDQSGDWPDRWEAARRAFGVEIAALRITPESDPQELLESFTKGAKSMGSIAYALQNVIDRPDWYQLLGSAEDEEQVS